MSDEKWNRFAATGSVRDYLEYRACVSEELRGGARDVKRETVEDRKHGADHPVERNGALRDAGW